MTLSDSWKVLVSCVGLELKSMEVLHTQTRAQSSMVVPPMYLQSILNITCALSLVNTVHTAPAQLGPESVSKGSRGSGVDPAYFLRWDERGADGDEKSK